MDPKQVADMFVEADWLNAEQGHALAQEAATTGKPIENVMVDHGIVTEDEFFALIAESLGTEVVDLEPVRRRFAHLAPRSRRAGPTARGASRRPCGQHDLCRPRRSAQPADRGRSALRPRTRDPGGRRAILGESRAT